MRWKIFLISMYKKSVSEKYVENRSTFVEGIIKSQVTRFIRTQCTFRSQILWLVLEVTTCPRSPVAKALGLHVQQSVTRTGAGVQSSDLSLNPAFPARHAPIAHTYQFPSSPWACALDRYTICTVSALRSTSRWTSASNKGRKDPKH